MEHFWCTNESHANTDSQDSPQPGLVGNHYLPPYSIFSIWPWGQHPNIILSWDSQVRVPKFIKLGLPQLWGPIILCSNLRLRWGFKQSCSPHRTFFNGMVHTTCTQGSESNSRLLVIRVKLPIWLPTLLLAITYVFSTQMGHASPFYTFAFQELSNDIRKFLIQWFLTPAIALWKFRFPLGLHWDSDSQSGSSLGSCGGSFPHILLHSWEHEMWLPS